MKKVLLGTTAIVAAGMIASAPSANAAEKIKLQLGGYMEQYFGFVANDDSATEDFSGFDVKSDAEVFFKGKTTLDNGIEVGLNIQLEGNTSGDTIDESYMTFKGQFGQLDVGSENSAQYKMHYAPADFGIGINSGDQFGWVSMTSDAQGDSINQGAGYFRGPFGSTYIEPTQANDSTKLTYYTPRVEGFQLGLSYSPDTKQDSNGGTNRDAENTDLVMAGLNFNRNFGSSNNFRASLGYGTVLDEIDSSGNTPTSFNAGVGLKVGGFGVGVSYANFDDHGATTGHGLSGGVNYSSGPWGVSLAYFHGEKDGTAGVDALGAGTIDGEGQHDTIHLSAKYALGPGVRAQFTLGHSEFESDDTDLVNEDAAEVEATYVVVGVKLSF